MANLAQIVNVLHAPIMTDGAAMWLTPTYYAFQLHKPHVGATALPVEIVHGAGLPAGASNAVSGTASQRDGATAVTLMNRHMAQSASVRLRMPASRVAQATVLAADSPRAQNSAHTPDRVALAPLAVQADGAGVWRIELPPHCMATVQFAA